MAASMASWFSNLEALAASKHTISLSIPGAKICKNLNVHISICSRLHDKDAMNSHIFWEVLVPKCFYYTNGEKTLSGIQPAAHTISVRKVIYCCKLLCQVSIILLQNHILCLLIWTIENVESVFGDCFEALPLSSPWLRHMQKACTCTSTKFLSTLNLFKVKVPVLSLHRTSMPAISSIAVMRFVIAPYVFPLTPPAHYFRPNSGMYVQSPDWISSHQ